MVEYKCKKCGHVFARKTTYDNHINLDDCTKTGRKSRTRHYVCDKCDYETNRRDNFNCHMASRHPVQNNIANNNVDRNIPNNNAIANNAINAADVDNNAQVHANVDNDRSRFSRQIKDFNDNFDMKCLTDDEMTKLVASDRDAMSVLFEMIYCNRNRVEYNNIFLFDTKDAIIFAHGKWSKSPLNETIYAVLMRIEDYIIDFVDQNIDDISDGFLIFLVKIIGRLRPRILFDENKINKRLEHQNNTIQTMIEILRKFTIQSGINMNVLLRRGKNKHNTIEGMDLFIGSEYRKKIIEKIRKNKANHQKTFMSNLQPEVCKLLYNDESEEDSDVAITESGSDIEASSGSDSEQ